MLPTHAFDIEKIFTSAFGTGIVATFGFLVESWSAWIAKVTATLADASMTCENTGDVLPVTLPFPP